MTGAAVLHKAFGVPRMRLSVRRGSHTAAVLVGTVGLFAARTSLPVDRLRDVAMILEALVQSLPGARVTVDVRLERDGDELQIAVCDLPRGFARSVIAGAGEGALAGLLASASDGVAIRSTPRGGESLVVTFASTSS